MLKLLKQKTVIVCIVALNCGLMACVDGILQPDYPVKSFIKILLFSILPAFYALCHKHLDLRSLFRFKREGIHFALLAATFLFAFLVGGYALLGQYFDLSNVVPSLGEDLGITRGNFLAVALYISFVNSFLEEFFFRGFAFLKLKEVSSRSFAHVFSASAFAMYHAAMMLGWFSVPQFVLALGGLFCGGLFFNFFNEKFESIYFSWIIHMFANFAINLVGFHLFGLL